MSLQIRRIVLYNKTGDRRELSFKIGELNIITGKSKTGKSAILEIVEFCLGRSEFRIPEGVIRNNVEWYGLLLQSLDSQIFIAKKTPQIRNNSQSQVYLNVGRTVQIPPMETLMPNTNDDGLVEFLGNMVGMTENIHFPPVGDSRDPLEVNFKHARLFSFQRQTEIANDSILFHRQSEPYMAQTIRDVFPYILGAAREDQLIMERKLRQARRELKLLKRQSKEAEMVSGAEVSQAQVLFTECKQAGLIDGDCTPANGAEVIAQLRRVLESSSSTELASDDQISALQNERRNLLRQFGDVSDTIQATKSFLGDQDSYYTELNQQHLRLSSIGLYSEAEDNSKCPLCGSHVSSPPPRVTEIVHSLKRLELNLQGVKRDKPKLLEHISNLEDQKQLIKQKIKSNTETLRALTKNLKHQTSGDADNFAARILGRVSLFMETVVLVDESSELNRDITSVQSEVDRLESLLDSDAVDERMDSVLNRIGRKMTDWAERLQLEHNDVPYRLDLKRLTVVADREERPIPMERMGSGENWLGCHLVAHLALHYYFSSRNRPVFNVLILDQPTQVYFPPEVYSKMQGDVKELGDEDRIAVKRLFDLLFKVLADLDGTLQIIVTDHANLNDAAFQSALVEEPWRNGNALIPEDWWE